MRYTTQTLAVLLTAGIAFSGTAAEAQPPQPQPLVTPPPVVAPAEGETATPENGLDYEQEWTLVVPDLVWSAPVRPRPRILPVLYSSFIALQAYDGYATTRGVERGAVESNPLLSGFAHRPAAIWAIKGAGTVGGIYLSERLWKRGHRGAAIGVMVVSNAVMSVVAAHNASLMKRLP